MLKPSQDVFLLRIHNLILLGQIVRFLSSLRKTFSTILLWFSLDPFETIKISSKKQITPLIF